METLIEDTVSKRTITSTLSVGQRMNQFIGKLFPICRSITGDGVVQTIDEIKKYIPVEIHRVATGTKVFDWEVPKEWNIKSAYIKNSKGEIIIDFSDSNLHVLNYSVPVHKHVTLTELKEHLHTMPEHPDWIPYRNSYYKEDWGFCIAYNQFRQLPEDWYEVHIDSTLEEGHLTYAEYFIPGELQDEVLLSTHICHPSLCNDNLSGIAVLTFLARQLTLQKQRYSYRFIFIPGTIGAITWLSINEQNTKHIKHGLIASLLGGAGAFIYKKSRGGDAEIDQVVTDVLKSKSINYKIIEFTPYGYDERQFCSPGFNLPMGCLTRALYGQFAEYHTSADDLTFAKADDLEASLYMYEEVIGMLEANRKYINQNPKCEPQLGKRKLYDTTGGSNHGKSFQMALLWVLNLSDGDHSLLDIKKRSGLEFDLIHKAAMQLLACDLLKEDDREVRFNYTANTA